MDDDTIEGLVAGPNGSEAQQWNGIQGEHWVTHAARYDAQLRPVGRLLLDAGALEATDRVLDVGCGCGTTTIDAARLASEGKATGVDLSVAMLERARAVATDAGVENVEFHLADAQTHQFEPGSFDAAISRFGVMFFADAVAAFANLAGALRPGGRLVFAAWQPRELNDWITIPAAAFERHVTPPPPLPVDAPGMFGLARRDRLAAILDEAGCSAVEIEGMEVPMLLGGGGTLADTVDFLRTGSLGRSYLERAEAETARAALADLTDALGPHVGRGGVTLGGRVWLVRARTPERRR